MSTDTITLSTTVESNETIVIDVDLDVQETERGQGDGSAVSFFQTIRKGLQKQKGGDIMGTKERESNAMSLL